MRASDLKVPTVDPVLLATYHHIKYSDLPTQQHAFVFMILHDGNSKTHNEEESVIQGMDEEPHQSNGTRQPAVG